MVTLFVESTLQNLIESASGGKKESGVIYGYPNLHFALDSHHAHLFLDIKKKNIISLAFLLAGSSTAWRLRWDIMRNVFEFNGFLILSNFNQIEMLKTKIIVLFQRESPLSEI